MPKCISMIIHTKGEGEKKKDGGSRLPAFDFGHGIAASLFFIKYMEEANCPMTENGGCGKGIVI